MIYWQLFWAFMQVGFLGFGGGMAIISLIQQQVLGYGWMTETEFIDIVAISQVTPGPIGINCATYVGYTATGSVWGSVLATAAIIIPSLIIMLTICFIYDRISAKWQDNKIYQRIMRFIRILVVCLIAFAAYRMVSPSTFIDATSWLIFAGTVICMLVPDIMTLLHQPNNKITELISHPILLILIAGFIGYLIY